MALHLYLIQRTQDWGYDQNDGFVIAAENEAQVRSIAADHARDEPKSEWCEAARSDVTLLGSALDRVEVGVVLRDLPVR